MVEPHNPSKYTFMTVGEVESMPPVPWLVEGILPASALSILCGDAGTGKSFLALDWALCIATGRPWQERAIQKGTVVYIAAEGISGLGKRIRAWKQEFQQGAQTNADIYFFGESIPLLDCPESDFVEAIRAQLKEPPILIIIDTLARCMVGGEENMAQYMGRAIEVVSRIRSGIVERYASTQHNIVAPHILFVHHTPKGGRGPRGHSSLRGAADVVIEIKRQAANSKAKKVQMVCDKQKDADAFDPIALMLKEVSLSTNDQNPNDETSCILVQAEQSSDSETSKKQKAGKKTKKTSNDLGELEAREQELVGKLNIEDSRTMIDLFTHDERIPS